MFKGAAGFKRSCRCVIIALAFLVVLLLSIVYFFSYIFCAFCYFDVLNFFVNHFTNRVYLLFIILCQFSIVNVHSFNCLVFRYTFCYLFFYFIYMIWLFFVPLFSSFFVIYIFLIFYFSLFIFIFNYLLIFIFYYYQIIIFCWELSWN